MQKINSLEQWQDKAKQYNPKTGNSWIWAMMIAMLLMVFATPYIYPAPICWENITCNNYANATPGEPVTEVCAINNIIVDGAPRETILIEVIQGGANSDRDYSFIANRDSVLVTNYVYFEMSEETTPTYILCHAYEVGTAATGGYEAGKAGLLNFWMSTSNSTERDYNKAIIVDFNSDLNIGGGFDMNGEIYESASLKLNNDNRVLWFLTFIAIAILIYINWLLTYRNGYSIIFWILNALIIPSAYIIIPSGQFPYLLLATMFCIFIVIIELGKWLTKRRM